jgi:type II secretory ATPase GspE/PulE/Tfp pilus assembly ATPase PilB-like protein
MGIEPCLVSSTNLGVLAQRLIRRVCPQCRKSYAPHPEQVRELGVSKARIQKAGGRFFRGQGCEHCRETGYRGRLGVHELLVMTEPVKAAVLESADANFIQRSALKDGMITMRKDGTSKVLRGLTTPEELLSITSDAESGGN